MQLNLFKLTSVVLLLIAISAIKCFAQQPGDTLKTLNQRFQAFDYERTISTADSILNFRDSLSKNLLLEIYRIKGISHFSLLQDELAQKSFLEIVKLDTAYTLDTAKNSPKIITFYNQVKNFYKEQLPKTTEPLGQRDTVYITRLIDNPETSNHVKNSIVRSLVLPGWGHLYAGYQAKGIVLTSLGILAIASSAYFIIDSERKEEDYINTTLFSEISAKYDEYNFSYKMKNYSLIALAAVWLYAQLDMLIFSDPLVPEMEQINADLSVSSKTINFGIKFNF